MRVGFDLSPTLPPHSAGIARAVESTVAALEMRGAIEVVPLVPPKGMTPRAFRKGHGQRVRDLDLSGIHSFTSAFAWSGPGQRVQTIHELPWRHGCQENAGWRHRFWASLGARRADGVVTASKIVADEIGLNRSGNSNKLHVIPWGVDGTFFAEPPDGVIDEVLLGTYSLPERPLLLCPGAVREKKNLGALLRGVAELVARKGPVVQIVITGPDTPDLRTSLGLAQQLGLGRFISTPGNIEQEHLPGLMRLASVVPVLSHSEGFALPVLEAHASGTATLTPTGSVQAETAGGPGFHCDPKSPASVADGIAQALKEGEDRRTEMIDHAAAYTWERTAEGIEKVWESLA